VPVVPFECSSVAPTTSYHPAGGKGYGPSIAGASARGISFFPYMTESGNPDPTPARPSKPDRPPSIALGILMLVIMGPIVASLAFALVTGSITSAGSVFLAAGFILVGTAVIVHFFFGHRVTWILPVLVILMGIMGITMGIHEREPVAFLFGGMLTVVGVAWRVPSTVNHPIARWIVKTREELLRSSNDGNK
jgi:hypothetical protein